MFLAYILERIQPYNLEFFTYALTPISLARDFKTSIELSGWLIVSAGTLG